jgi:hypothetical protein
VKLFFKHPALPLEVTLSYNYLVCFAILWQFKTLYMSSKYIYISSQSCKVFFKHSVFISL